MHIYKRVIDQYKATYDSVTVVQYKYFYPYNDWWNNHEGDWQGIDVVVSSSDPNTATILGVEYRFHKVWVNYYKDWGSNPGLTTNFVFNPHESVRLSQGTHPVVYVGAGSHAAYPVGGKINVFNALEIISDRIPGSVSGDGSNEYMTHTGLVLSTQADDNHSNLWERYDLQLLPEPDLNNTDNMGLDPAMSWLGARIRWGTPSVSSPFPSANNREPGNVSPKKGPYNSNSKDWGTSKGWGELGLFDVASKLGDPFKHKDLPKGDYHHWMVLGDETWSGTVNLLGDVVVFPGATLTIEPGTIIEFEPGKDRHQFSTPGSVSDLAEFFVYGTLNAEGTSTSPVRFSRKSGTPAQASYAWGGIRIMPGGSVDLDHTTIRDTPPPPPPTGLTAQAGTGQATLRWDAYPVDASITAWQYRLKPEGVGWRDWQTMPNSGPLTAEHTVTGLINGETSTFLVRAVNPTGAGSAAAAVSADIPLSPPLAKPTHTPTLTAHAGDGEVTLRWDEPNAIQCTWQYQQTKPSFLAQPSAWKPIPASKTFTTEHTVGELTNGQTYVFKVRAVNTGGQGPESAAMSVTPIAGGHKVPPQPTTMLSVKGPITRPSTRPGQLYVSWAAVSATPVVNGYTLRYQSRPDLGAAISPWSDWCILPDAIAAGTTSYTHTGLRGDTLYRYQVRATNAQGQGAWSAAFPVVGLEPNAPTKPPARWPSAPQNLIAAAANESVTLTWQAPVSNGGATITGYRYRYRAAGSTRWSPSAEGMPLGQTTSHTVRTLTNGTEYTFEVWAVNKVGNGASASKLATPAGVPDAPVLSTWARTLDGRVALTTRLGAENGAPITRTETRVYSVSEGDTTWVREKGTWQHDSVNPSASYYRRLFTGGRTMWHPLTNGVAYTFEVRSVNRVGPSAIASVEATPGQSASSRVARLPLTASIGDGQVVLGWPTANGSAVVRYEMQSRVARSGHGWPGWSAVPGGSTAQDTTITGLLNGTEYEFRARRVDDMGVPLAVSNVVLATPAGRPGVPVLTAAGGNGQVALDWPAAAANGSAVVRYEMQSRVAAAGHGWPGWSAVPGRSTARDTTITGLLNGVSYQVQAQAVDSQGSSVAMSNVESATPAGPPGAPALTASGGKGQVALGWTAAAANGSAIARYEVQGRVAAAGHGWPGWAPVPGGSTARDTTITGLTNGTPYEFAVRAVNGVGAGASSSQQATPQAAAPIAVSFGAASYQATEGGEAVKVSVGLSPSPVQTVRIPVGVSADMGTEAGDYTVAGLNGGTVGVSFAAGVSSQSFALTANEDADIDDETVSLSFGTLPAGVVVGTTRQATVTLDDDDADTKPVFSPSGTARDALTGHYFSFTRPAATGGNGALTYSVSGTCAGLTVTASSVSGQPSKAGQCGITWTVRDTDGDTDTYALQIAVAADTAPSFASSGTSKSAITGQYFSFTRPAASGGNGALRYSVSGTCAGLTVTTSSASGQPSKAGQCGITWTVRDTDGDTDTYALQIAVAADTAPSFASSGTSKSALVGQYFSFTRPAASGGNGALRYSVSGSCPGLTITSSSASGSPSSSGPCVIKWTVRDTDGDTDTYALQIAVAADTAPSFASSGTSKSAITGQYFSFTRPAASGGNGALRYSVSGSCAGLTVTTSSASGAPSKAGSCRITWTVRDTDGDTDTYALQISVAADTAPSFAATGTTRSATVGQYFSFTRPSASGGNGSLRYSVSGTCAGLTVTTSSASGSPSKAGSCRIKWTVRDTDGDTDTYSLQLSVRHRRT